MPTHFCFEPGALVTNRRTGVLGRVFRPIGPHADREPVFETSDAIALTPRVPDAALSYVRVYVGEGRIFWHPRYPGRQGQRLIDSSVQSWHPADVQVYARQPRNLHAGETIPGTRVMHRFRPVIGTIESWHPGSWCITVLVGEQRQDWPGWQVQYWGEE